MPSVKTNNKKQKLLEDFKFLFWGYKFNKIDPIENKRLIIVNTFNYGTLHQWKYLVKLYGFENLREILRNIPASEFRRPSMRLLIKLLFHIKDFKYATRGAYIKAARGI